jgi:phenylacetate-CoA ligase
MGFLQDWVTQNRLKCFLADRVSSDRRAIRAAWEETVLLEHGSPGEIRDYQQAALRRLLVRARAAPYWRCLLDQAGVQADRAQLSDLARLPFLTKQILSSEGERLRLPDASDVRQNYSGGSTGIPVCFWQDRHFHIWQSAATRRLNQWAGASTGARLAKLWGAPQDARQIEGPAGRVKLWLLNQRYYDTFDMGPRRMASYHRSMEQFRPDLIQAYASSVHLLACYLRGESIRPRYPKVSIITAAEKLVPHMRAEIEAVFPAKVFDRYGSREIPAIAAECQAHDGLHVAMGHHIVETINPDTGEAVEDTPGEIVVTSLHNFAMPFLRYRIGDWGVLTRQPCRCGSPLIRLREVIGRTSDNFLMEDGRIVHGEYFTHLFYGEHGIAQFQFVQESIGQFTLRLVPTARYSARVAERVEQQVRQMIGPRARFRVEVRTDIPRTASGKHRFTISHVAMEEMLRGRPVREQTQ